MMTAISQDPVTALTETANDSKIMTHSLSPSLTPYHLNVINTFPWMEEFIKHSLQDMINPNTRSLEKLMNLYHKNIIESVEECYSEPIRATILKRCMSEVLIFFHISYSELKLPLDSSIFLTKMSDLMALYLDMEIEASRSGTESLQIIASKITSCLYIYFGCSHGHILDTILKTKMIDRDSWELSDLIFRRVLRDPPGSSENIIMYMRYLLAFKLWKGIMGSAEERKRIQLMAELQLIPPPDFKEKLSCSSALRDIFPRILESETNITRFLLEAKYIIRDKIEMFIKAVADPKLQCGIDRQNFASTNYFSIPDEKEDDGHNKLIDDWSDMNLESDIEDISLFKKINDDLENIIVPKLNNGLGCVRKNELQMNWINAEMTLEDIGEDENSTRSLGILKNDKIYQVGCFWEADIMDVAAEVELSSNCIDVTEIPTIKLEPQPSQSKENVVYSWDISNTHSYEDHNFDSKSEFIVDKTPEQTKVFGSENKPQFFINKKQAFESCPSTEDHSSAQRFGLIHSEQVVTDSKSIEVKRTQNIVNEKNFPLVPINIHFEKHHSGLLSEEQNEEISSEEHNEELPLGEFNEEMHVRELDDDCINETSSGELNEEKYFEECISGKTIESSNVERPSELSEATPPEKRGLLHDFTLKNDNKIYKFHVKLSTYWEKLNRHTWINLLFPLFSQQDIKTPRCNCFICTQNYNTIMKNWKSAVTNLSRLPRESSNMELFSVDFDCSILKEMKELLETGGLKLLVWEPEMDEIYTRIEELIKEENKHSNLPLKKRKAFSFNAYVKDENKEISYPNTPMISIAEVELAKENHRFNAMSINLPSTCNAPPPPLNYVPDYLSHPSYPNPADIEFDDVTVESDIASIPTDLNPPMGPFTTSFIPEHQDQGRPKFKTPAQLKQFQHLSAAEDLINFSLTSQAYYNEKEKRKIRQKTKYSRKRKRAT